MAEPQVARTAAVSTALVLALAGCYHHHLATNAPGLVDPRIPPGDLDQRGLEQPGDPGEHLLLISPGVTVGAGGGTIASTAVVDVAAEVTVRWGDSEVSHNDADARLFLPRGLRVPDRSVGFNVGWSALRLYPENGTTSAGTGPIFVEAVRTGFAWSLSAGWALDPRTGGTGPQLGAHWVVYFVRGRALFGDGFEVVGGVQLKAPQAWIRSR